MTMITLQMELKDYNNLVIRKKILEIIKEKELDVGTYIFNTQDYEEYLFEAEHLKEEEKLNVDEYYLIKNYFMED